MTTTPVWPDGTPPKVPVDAAYKPGHEPVSGPTAEQAPKPIPPCNVGVYAQMLPKLREVAKSHGYAIGLHGSMQRDFDLMAMPWTEQASPTKVLVEAMAEAVQGYIPFGGGQYRDGEWKLAPMPAIRPHGRESWTITFRAESGKGQHPFIDISIMPSISDRDRLARELEGAKERERVYKAEVDAWRKRDEAGHDDCCRSGCGGETCPCCGYSLVESARAATDALKEKP